MRKIGSGRICRRRHPKDPNYLMCNKCNTYKVLSDFSKSKGTKCGASVCKECKNKYEREKRLTPEGQLRSRLICKKYYYTHHSEIIERMKGKNDIWRRNNPDKARFGQRRREKRMREELRDVYIVADMKKRGELISHETIDLVRQRIIMKRTLKEFKKIKEEINESNRGDVQGEQRKDEVHHDQGAHI